MITKSDLKIIKECLQAEGVRNSDFQEANKVIDKNNSYIAFIYEGKNYKIKVSNFEAIKSIIFNGNTITPDENGNVVITQKDAITLVKFYGPEFPIYTTQPEPNIKDGDYFYHTYSRQLMQWQNRGWHVVTLQPGLYFMQPDQSLWLYTEEQGLVRLLEDKQDLLISGTNIKTINGKSILGQGDLTITASQGSTIINYNGSQFLRIDDITDFSFPSSMSQDSIPEGGQILYDSVRHRFIYVVNGIMYTEWPQMEGVMASDAYATVDFVYKLGANVKIWKVTPNGLIDLISANEDGVELLPFSKVEDTLYVPILEERSDEGIITYMQPYNVFALYIEENDDYYLLWTETENRKSSEEYNLIDRSTTVAPYDKEEDEPVYTVRQDKIFYLETNADDLTITVDTSLDTSSTNPVTNAAISNKFEQIRGYIDKALGFKDMYEISYVGDSYEDFPDGDEQHTYALEDAGILYKWNSTTGEWDLVEREAESRDIIIYQGKIGYLYPDELEWQATIAIPEDYRPMLIDSLLPNGSIYLIEIPTYTGNSGIVVVDAQRNKALLKVTNGNTVKYYNKWLASDSHASSDFYQPSNTLYIFISNGSLHMGIVKNSNFIELAANGNITIDNGLSPNSSNPVKNSAIYNKFNEVSQNFNDLSSIVNGFSNTRLMPIDGVVTEQYSLIQQQGYGGSDGKILIDEANARIILFVEGTPNKGYTEWGDAGGRYLSSEYDIHNQFFWLIDSNDVLHIYKYLEREVESESQQGITPVLLMASPQSMPDTEITTMRKLVEVASSENINTDEELSTVSTNPVQNRVITNSVNQLSDRINSLVSELNNREDIAFYHIAGVLSSNTEIRRAFDEYTGDDGVVVLYPGSISTIPEVLLAVDVDTGEEITTEYYSTWSNVGIYPDSSYYAITNWNTAFFIWESGRGIHIGKTSGLGEVLEIITPGTDFATIDNELSMVSSNPVSNSATTTAIMTLTTSLSDANSKVAALESKSVINGTPLLHFDGFVSEFYSIPANDPVYRGTGGSILYDKANTRFVLKVSNKYYRKWEEASDKAASTNYTVGNILIWNVLESGLHIYYVTQDRVVKEVTQVDSELNTESPNPIANNAVTNMLNRISSDTIHTIYVKGENYMTFENPIYGTPVWEPGLIWYNQNDDDEEWFKICTKVTQGVPTFDVFTPKDSNLFYYGFDDCSYYTYVGNSELMKVFDSTTADTVEHLSEVEIQVLERIQALEDRGDTIDHFADLETDILDRLQDLEDRVAALEANNVQI